MHANLFQLDQPSRAMVRGTHPPNDRTWQPPQRESLEKDIRAWVTNWNDNPKPFVWNKTAEQILQSIQRLMKRINGAEH
jgi:hypothetical protein